MSRKEVRTRAKALAKEYGYLPYMIERYLFLWGEEETLEFLKACENPIQTSIRLNTLKSTLKATRAKLEQKGIHLKPIPWIEEGFFVDFGNYSPGAVFEHLQGQYYVQGVPSMTVVKSLDPHPEEVIMDLAAAPGGKTTHIAQLMKNKGLLMAVEQDKVRISSLISNVRRCGVKIALILRGDAKKVDQIGIRPIKILLDAPCSGEGLIPLDPTRKTSKTMADIRFCATRQDKMLESAIKLLKPGGDIVYSTCSIAPEENEFVIDEILRKHPELQIIPINLEYGIEGYTKPYGVQVNESMNLTRRFLPHKHGLEGFFICKMTKEGEL